MAQETPLRSRVSILMRTKNRTAFLDRGIRSVLSQTAADWGLIIINDGGDETELTKVLEKYRDQLKDRLKVVHFAVSEGRGTGRHLNAGLEASQSEFVAIHDDDDTWDSQFLEKTLKAVGDGAAVVTQSVLVKETFQNEGLTEVSRSAYEPWQKHAISLFRLAEGLTFPPIAMLFRRDTIDEIGAFDPTLGPLEDWEFSLRLFARFSVLFFEEPLAFYHQRDAASGSAANSQARTDIVYGRIDTELRNALLRKDLAEGRMGLGFLVNIAQMQGRLFKEIQK